MVTKFGPEAKDGDYVLILDVNYMKGTAETLIGKVYKNKAYTGVKQRRSNKYIHKEIAQVVIPESFVSDEMKDAILEDINLHNPAKAAYDRSTNVWRCPCCGSYLSMKVEEIPSECNECKIHIK